MEIISYLATTNNVTDGEVLPDLLKDAPDAIAHVSCYGAYDQRSCYDPIKQREAKAANPPRKGAKI